jgi:hypothetical protein
MASTAARHGPRVGLNLIRWIDARSAAYLFVVCMSLPGLALCADHRKGRVQKDTTTCVTVDDGGKPIVGGKFRLEFWPKAEGNVLAVRVTDPAKGADGWSLRYLAYPLERDVPAELRLLSEPGPGCYWLQKRFHDGRAPDMPIVDIDYYVVRDGSLAGYELTRDGTLLVLVKKGSMTSKHGPYVGRRVEYDNLDDGK